MVKAEIKRIYRYVLIAVILITLLGKCRGIEPMVEVKQGKLIGNEETSENGNRYSAFRSIPYAEPPVGELRFQPPQAINHWDVIMNSTEDAPSCHQAGLGYREGQEDCLYLSIYTPQLPENEETLSLPVLVWLHGGAFITGSAKQYDPYLIMNRKMVLVVPQYRLGLFGYYSTRSPTAIGNYGTLDQLLALKWVQENIDKFGGNPDQTTLGGDCAGGVSAIHHMISPLSKGLFQRVISLSGSPLSPWALKPNHNRLLLGFSNQVNCPNYELSIMTHCFKNRSAEELMDVQQSHLETYDYLVGNDQIGPAVQVPAFVHESNLILEDHPIKKLLQKDFPDLPVLLGVTRDVGAYMFDMGIYDLIQWQLESDPDYMRNKFMNSLLTQLRIYQPEDKIKRFIKHYLPEWDLQSVEDAIPGLELLLGDAEYNAGIIALAKILSKNTEVRLLRFDYEGGPKLFEQRHPIIEERPPIPANRVSHGDELFFLFPEKTSQFNDEQKKVSEHLLNTLENFVYGREPQEGWPLFTSEGLETAVISVEGQIQLKNRFATNEREKMLDFIFRHQHHDAFEEIKSEGQIDLSTLKHDEL